MIKQILITGGAGFIGSYLANQLTEKGYIVTVIDNLSKQIHGQNPKHKSSLFLSLSNKVNFIEGCVTNKRLMTSLIRETDAIIHLAAETGTGQSMYDIRNYNKINVMGTANILDILVNNAHHVKKILVASSRAIYGEGKYNCKIHGLQFPSQRKESDMLLGKFNCLCQICGEELELLPTSEDSKIHPSSVYGITKQVQEQLVLNVSKSIGLDAVALRYQNVYGPGQSLSNPYTGILSIFSNLILNNKPINIFEDGFESRDFVYISDVVEATILALEGTLIGQYSFNVGSGKLTDVLTVVKILEKLYNTKANFNVSGNFRKGDIRHNLADLTNINKFLNYKPRVSMDKGLLNFTNWVKTQNLDIINYKESIEKMKSKNLFS